MELSAYQEKIKSAAQEAIANKTFPGGIVGVVSRSGERLVVPFGRLTYDQSSAAVTPETIYDVASITKSIPTGSLALQLLEQGKLKLEDRLIDYIPEFANSDREIVLIKHLLTYTLDGYGFAPRNNETGEELMQMLMTRDFNGRPGTVFKYTNIPAALLGLVIERITGTTLDVLANKEFFIPLKMNATTFHPEKLQREKIAPTEIDSRGEVRGEVHDESAWTFRQSGKVMGHAGLFSTAPDILNFLEMLLNKGAYNGVTYFKPETVALMGTNQIAELNEEAGLGWELNQERYMGAFAGPHVFGKTGFTGTLCVSDVDKGLAYVILSNRTYPKRPANSDVINAFRHKIGDIVAGTI